MNTSALTSNVFISWSISKFSPRMKRLIYLSSLAAIANNLTGGVDLDKEIVLKLDSLLQLSKTSATSLRLPIYMCAFLWANKEVIHDELDTLRHTKDTCDANAMKVIINMTPSWIRYSDDETTMSDISRVFCPGKKKNKKQ